MNLSAHLECVSLLSVLVSVHIQITFYEWFNSVDHRMTYRDRYGYYPTTPIVILRCSASFLLLLPRQAMYQGLQANLAVYYAKARLVDWVVGGAAMADSGWHAWYVSGVAAWLCIICHEHCILHMGKMWQATVPNQS